MRESAAELAPKAALQEAPPLPLRTLQQVAPAERESLRNPTLLFRLAAASPSEKGFSSGLLEAAAGKMEFATVEMMGVLAKRSAEPWANKIIAAYLNGSNKTDAQVTASSLIEQAALVEANPEAATLLTTAAKVVPYRALDALSTIKDPGLRERIVRTAAASDPVTTLRRLDRYAGEAFAKEIVSTLAPADPEKIIGSMTELLKIDSAWATRLGEQAVPKTGETLFYYVKEIAAVSPQAAAQLFRVFSRQSIGSSLFYADKIAFFPEGERAVGEQTARAPSEALRRILKNESSGPVIARLIQQSGEPWAEILCQVLALKATSEVKQSVAALLPLLLSGELSLPAAVKLAGQNPPTALFKQLARLSERPGIGDLSVASELDQAALKVVRKINNDHALRPELRFAPIKDFSVEETYKLLAHGLEEAAGFPSTLKGLYARIEQFKIPGDELIRRVNSDRIVPVATALVNNERFAGFLSSFSSDHLRTEFLQLLVLQPAKSSDAGAQGLAVSELFNSRLNPALTQILRDQIVALHSQQREGSELQGIYGILSAVLAKRLGESPDPTMRELNTPAFVDLAMKYVGYLRDINEMKSVKVEDLFQNGIMVQRYIFRDDPRDKNHDGWASFTSFMSRYEGQPGWRTERLGAVVHISSTAPGKRIEIFANDPHAGDRGIDDTEKVLKARDAVPTFFAFRGHSYLGKEVLDRVNPQVRLVYLGSCGGFSEALTVLERCVSAQILSTRGEGTKVVNDPLLKKLNEALLALAPGGSLAWETFEKAIRAQIRDPRLASYVFPHKNSALVYIGGYTKWAAEHGGKAD
jgi:hypothetical protein